MDINNTLDELYNLSKFGIKLGLDNIREIMNRLGNPQEDYKVIHIAGTNGKGSTASMLEAGLLEAGYKVGKYTSPHIVRFNERIVVDREEISDEEIVEYYKKVREVMKELPATFFEVTTAMMFLYFKDKGVDYVVLEVGLGGKYDATNIVKPEYSIITSISLDHVNILGDNLLDIAREKAGIIKDGIKVFVTDTGCEVKKAVEEATDLAVYTKEAYDYKIGIDTERLITRVEVDGEEFELSLFGEFQGINFLNVYSVLKELGIRAEVIKKAMLKVKWPGRFEIARRSSLLILDGAHNEDSALKLEENLGKIGKREDITMLVSILEDKDIEKILSVFNRVAHKIVFTSLSNFHRGLDAKAVYDKASEIQNKMYFEDIKEAYEQVEREKILVVAGSFYLLSKFKEEIGIDE